MNNLVPIDASRQGLSAPQRMQQRMQQGVANNSGFADGIAGGFPVLSIRSSKFHIRLGQDEKTIPDPVSGYPAAYLDVVLINGSKQLAKAFYVNAYAQGSADQPDCWSMDSIRPDASVLKKVNPTCGDCPMNAFGSRVTPDGKQAKACADHRRIVVAFPNELAKPDPTSLLLRVPQSSLRSLRNYVDLLARNGYEPGGCVTRLSFDPAASFPKLEFRFVGPVTDQEFGTVEQLMTAPNTKAMLQAADFENVAATANQPSKVDLQPLPRQPPVDVMAATGFGGFGPGMVTEENDEPEPLVQQTMAMRAAEPVQQQTAQLLELADGRFFNPLTGQIVDRNAAPPPEPVLDPAVLTLADGRFFHQTKGQFVASPYVEDAVTAPATQAPAAQPAGEPVKKKRRSSAEVAAEKAAKAAASQNLGPVPQDNVPQTNGHATTAPATEKPTVVAASPKLENLLAGLAPKKDQ